MTQVCSNPASLLMRVEPHYQLMIQVELESPALSAALQFLVSEGQEIIVGQKILSLGYPREHAESIVRINITGGKEIHITPAEEVTAGEDIIMQCMD